METYAFILVEDLTFFFFFFPNDIKLRFLAKI